LYDIELITGDDDDDDGDDDDYKNTIVKNEQNKTNVRNEIIESDDRTCEVEWKIKDINEEIYKTIKSIHTSSDST
jgi:hypothetical protein